MYSCSQKRTSFSYVIMYFNLLSFFILIISNMILLCSSFPSNSAQVLLNDWNTMKSETPSSARLPKHFGLISGINKERITSKNFTNSLNNIKSDSKFDLTKIDNSSVPSDLQWKRFMWKEVDETMDNIAKNVATGAKAMKNMIDSVMSPGPELARYKKAAPYYSIPATSSTTNVKYILKSPLKRNKIVKLSGGSKRIIKIISPPSITPHFEALTRTSNSKLPNTVNVNEFKFLNNQALRDIEKKEEEKVEATISALLPNFGKEQIITGKFKDFEDDWMPITKTPIGSEIYSSTTSLPITSSFSTSNLEKKSKPMSQLHTRVSDLPLKKYVGNAYEVTENSAEETIEQPDTYKPQKYATYNQNQRGFIDVTTTEIPNYPSYFILHTKKNNNSITSSYSENNLSTIRKRPQNGNVSTSFTYISRVPRVENKNSKQAATTIKSTFSNTVTHEPIISVTLKKKVRDFGNVGGHKTFKDLQSEENTSHTLRYSPSLSSSSTSSSLRETRTDNDQIEQEKLIRNRGTKKFGDRLR